MTRASSRVIRIVAILVTFAGLAVEMPIVTIAHAIEPISGSLTFKGQPKTKLQRSPIGSTVPHHFHADRDSYYETYVLREDRSLELISRQRWSKR